MHIISLPDDLGIDTSEPIQLFSYETGLGNVKNKINLSKNTISFLLEGTKEIIADSRATTIENDHFVVIKSGRCLMTESISPQLRNYKSLLLFFTDAMLLNFMERQHLQPSPTEASKDHFKTVAYDTFLQQFVQGLHSLLLLPVAVRGKLLHIKFEELMTYLAQVHGPEFLAGLLRQQDQKMRHFTEVVEAAKLSKLNVQEVAFLCHMSISSLKRAFQKHYQTTPSKWFLAQRLQHAAYLLSAQKMRPIDLYDEVGFESLSTFTQAFKKHYGSTPKQFQLEKMNV